MFRRIVMYIWEKKKPDFYFVIGGIIVFCYCIMFPKNIIDKHFVFKNKLTLSIVLFLVLFSVIHFMKPSLFYMPDGSFREFGVGYKNKTVIPIWIVAIVLGILSYLSISYLILVS
jgi:hypothetical protein